MSNNITSNQTMNINNTNPESTSLQLMFAKLQMDMAEMVKTQAMERIEMIQKNQEEQKLCSQYLNEAEKLQAESVNASGGQTQMTVELAQYMNQNFLTYDKTGNDLWMSYDEWEVAISSLEGHLVQLGISVQQEMIYIQEYIGQYNSYLQGANLQISNSNQTLTSLSRGQTMYGDPEDDMVYSSGLINMDDSYMTQSMYGGAGTGLTMVTLLVGIVFGCLMTLFVQKMSKGKTKA